MASELTPEQVEAFRPQADLAAILDGIAQMEAERLVTLEELDARIRAGLSEV
jgi:hypothetical protein